MPKFDPRQHHRRSIRLPEYDYTQPGAYFITLCIEDRQCLLGEVVGGAMKLSALGHAAQQEWEQLAKRFPNIWLDAFAIMPNHIHGIIIIEDRDGRGAADDCRGTAMNLHDNDHSGPRRAPTREQFGKPVPGSIPTIIRSYKSSVTQRVNLLLRTPGAPFWQRNYYEHVIRNQANLERIRRYILENPEKWELDSVRARQ